MNKHRIMFITADNTLTPNVEATLRERFRVARYTNTRIAIKDAIGFDLIMIDNRVCGVHASLIAKSIRNEVSAPILVLLDRKYDSEIKSCLERGADSYLIKPVHPQLLSTQIDKLATNKSNIASNGVIKFLNFEIDTARKQVKYGDQVLDLRKREFEILLCLTQNRGKPIGRDVLCQSGRGYNASTEATIDVHISKLRRKLSQLGVQQLIETVYGFGYRIS